MSIRYEKYQELWNGCEYIKNIFLWIWFLKKIVENYKIGINASETYAFLHSLNFLKIFGIGGQNEVMIVVHSLQYL